MDDPWVEFIRSNPGMAADLIAKHAEDHNGKCITCSAGPQAGRKVFPCAIRVLAEAALRPDP